MGKTNGVGQNIWIVGNPKKFSSYGRGPIRPGFTGTVSALWALNSSVPPSRKNSVTGAKCAIRLEVPNAPSLPRHKSATLLKMRTKISTFLAWEKNWNRAAINQTLIRMNRRVERRCVDRVWMESAKDGERICESKSASEMSVWRVSILILIIIITIIISHFWYVCHNFNLRYLAVVRLINSSAIFVAWLFKIILFYPTPTPPPT